MPRWQVARAGDITTAVANLLVAPDAWRQALQAQGFQLLEVWPAATDPLAAAGQRLFHAVGVS